MTGRGERHTTRQEVRKVLGRLDTRWLHAANKEICDNLSALCRETRAEHQTEHVLAWASFFPGEVDLGLFISSHLPHCSIYLPRTLSDRSMTFVSIGANWVDEMRPGRKGIPEPEESSGLIYDQANASSTVVLVPGLAFTLQGGRLGRGGGHYDRFLGDSRMAGALKVGVCWSLQIVPSVPLESHDVLMDVVCTEERWVDCRAERMS